MDISTLTATQAAHKIESNTITVTAYAPALLAHIAAREPTLKAWIHLDSAQVLAEAKRLDTIPPADRGPLHGIAIGIKDVIDVKDMPTRHNSPLYTASPPVPNDAASTMLLRAAGALIIGKMTTTEFAATTVGPATTNPHDATRTPGGSSSGSAAAVADFHVPVAIGTQTGGSIIRPGSFCGVYAFKPTWGAVSREGQKVCSVNLDTVGIFARCVEDLELFSRALGLVDDEVPRSLSNGVVGLKFAFLKTDVWESAGPGTQKAMARGMKLLQAAGAQVTEIEFPPAFARLVEWRQILLHGDERRAFLCEYQRDKTKLAPSIVASVENPPSHKAYLEAFDGLAALRPQWDAIAEQYAAVVVPSVPDEAPKGLEHTGSAVFNGMWTALHVPVLNIPAFKGANDMPIGLSLVRGRYKDQALLQIGKAVAGVWLDSQSEQSERSEPHTQ